MKCENCPADSALGCTVGVMPYQLRSGDTGCAWNMRTIKKHMNDRKPVTNADCIRAMKDEELAKWLVFVEKRVLEINPALERSALYHDWLEWLKQEVDNG